MEISVEALASVRVLVSGAVNYRAVVMDENQILERRSYVRQILRNYEDWNDLTNEQIDQTMLRKTDSGYLLEDINGIEFFLHDKSISKAESDFRRIRSMMPFEFVNMTGKDFDWSKYKNNITQCKDMVNKYILHFDRFKSSGMGLYIYSGTKGSGKTMLACCLLNEISNRYVGSVKFINTLEFIEMSKKGFQEESEELQALYNASLLVIDDIGVQMSKEWIDTVFYRLINDRYTNKKPTIYTSNIEIDRLKMDDRITDRIECTTFQVRLPEESIRKATRQQAKNELLNEILKAP